MFKRRKSLPILSKIKEAVWPSMGWLRFISYVRLRIIRLSDTTKTIAASLAIGAAISFSPIIGTHLIQAGLIAFILRLNVGAALLGTLIGNPWTFPFMWWAAISLGSAVFGVFGLPAETALPEAMNFSVFWDLTTHEPMRIVLPWLVGGYLLALVTWPIFYVVFYHMVKAGKLARKQALLRKAKKAAKDVTGQKK